MYFGSTEDRNGRLVKQLGSSTEMPSPETREQHPKTEPESCTQILREGWFSVPNLRLKVRAPAAASETLSIIHGPHCSLLAAEP